MKKSKCLTCSGEIVTTGGVTLTVHASWEECSAVLNGPRHDLPSKRWRMWDAEIAWVGDGRF